jgi:uncharacterized protein DUF4242
MPRYLIERTFPDGLAFPQTPAGDAVCRGVDRKNAEHGVHWVHSYVSQDCRTTFCIYDAPSPEAARRAASDNGLPLDRITEVRVLDPFFYGV